MTLRTRLLTTSPRHSGAFVVELLCVAALSSLAACAGDESNLPSCEDGQQLAFSEGAWICQTPNASTGDDGLAALQCDDGEVVLFDRGQAQCGAVQSAEGGDITAVHTPSGSGLSGGDSSGAVTLKVEFADNGDATTAARGDHTHAFSALTDVPSGFADRIDDDVLGSLACSAGQTAVFDAGRNRWACGSGSAGVELDPTVNSLAKSNALDSCTADQVPMYNGSNWSCGVPVDQDSLAAIGACNNGETLAWQSGRFVCAPGPAALGDITSVSAGTGLSGGGAAGDVALGVNFAGACATGQVACSDHTHPTITPTLNTVLAESNDAGGYRVENLAPPIGAQDAVTKSYVDALGAGSSAMAFALCCGSECQARLDDWVCQDVDANGSAVVPMTDGRGMLVVPDSGQPTLIASGGGIQALEDCSDGWSVCSIDGVTTMLTSCGVMPSTVSPSPWQCWAPTFSYFMMPGMSGLIRTGTPAAPEIHYLADDGTAVAPPDSEVDCGGATPIGEPFPNSRIVLCVR